MAYLPERNFFEETLANNYTLSSGSTNFLSSDLSRFPMFSLQFIYINIEDAVSFRLSQSLDGSNWTYLSDEFDIPIGSGNFTIDKYNFTGKFLLVEVISANNGTLTINLLAKRR